MPSRREDVRAEDGIHDLKRVCLTEFAGSDALCHGLLQLLEERPEHRSEEERQARPPPIEVPVWSACSAAKIRMRIPETEGSAWSFCSEEGVGSRPSRSAQKHVTMIVTSSPRRAIYN